MPTQGHPRDVVFLSGKRTGFGAFGGSLRDFTATDLGVFSSAAALEAAGVSAELVDHTFFGNALQTSADALYLARHVALRVGVPQESPALTVLRRGFRGSPPRRLRPPSARVCKRGPRAARTGGE